MQNPFIRLERARGAFAAFFVLSLTAGSPARAVEPREPWRLDSVLPERLSIAVEFRARYEYLDQQFRVTRTGEEDLVVLRTLIHTRLRVLPWFTIGAELEDSRGYLSRHTLVTRGMVNSAELLRAYGELTIPDVAGGTFKSQAGRITMDVWNRRFVARNRFRNTINAFTGIDLRWSDDRGRSLRGFWTLPVQRLPVDPRRLQENDIEFDDETLDVQFWGVLIGSKLPWFGEGGWFLFGLHEDDTNKLPTRNRSLYTPGFRLFKERRAGRFDYLLEVAFQGGRSRATPVSPTTLEHFAHFEHAELGYTFDGAWLPRIAVQYDYASGDKDPDDGRNQRFDTLYGARRFDFGPTGIYGPFARSNINTPGIRFQVRPYRGLFAFASYRAFWLASARDVWVTTRVRDPAGRSGKFVGSQLEFGVRFSPSPGNLILESGYAHLFSGEFVHKAPNSTLRGDANYVYTQATVSF
jgi:hypothetical protein